MGSCKESEGRETPIKDWITYLGREDGVLRFTVGSGDTSTSGLDTITTATGVATNTTIPNTTMFNSSSGSTSRNSSTTNSSTATLQQFQLLNQLQDIVNSSSTSTALNPDPDLLKKVVPFLTYRGLFLFSDALIPGLWENSSVSNPTTRASSNTEEEEKGGESDSENEFWELFGYC
jgi:hypothetical protein